MDPQILSNKQKNIASFSNLPPESMNEIFKNFHDDKRSLYYCSLVNRYWCQLAIPWLWSQPIFNSESKDESISPIETLISCLDINSKIQLSELKIPIPSQRPLFEYTTFLKKLDHAELCAEVVMWLRNGLTREQLRIMRVVLPLSLEVKNILNIIIKELYKHFIKNSNLQMIILKGTGWGLDIPDILTINNLISGISNLRTLCYSIQPMLQIQIYENMLKFLDSLPNLCKDIENLELSMNTIDNNLERIFYNIIISQNNLTKFIFDCEFGPISKIINSLYTQSNSITFIEFRNIDFYCISLEFLLYFSYLKDLRLYDCKNITLQQLLPIRNSSNLNLKTLYLKSPDLESEVISLIIESSGMKLQNLFLIINSYLSNNIFNFCPDLKLIDLDFRIENIITSILSSIKFLPLEYLAIHCCTNPLKSLKENLPLTLKQLEIDVGIFQAEDLDDLLKDCQAPLKTMIIREGLRRILDNYIPILIDFTLKKKTLQTVGFYFLGGSSSFSPSIQELKKYVKVIKPSEISNHNTHTFLWSTIQLNNKFHATIFSTDSITESDETSFFLKRVNVMDLEKRKEVYEYVKNVMNQDYMMVLRYREDGNLRNILMNYLDYLQKIGYLPCIGWTFSLSAIHDAGKAHKDLHSGNILIFDKNLPFISDLGMCQPVNNNQEVS
ncbi:hypothetical protein RhiirC2_853671 [Rhizophagus irregularis]|uniref:Protein kinase domain-containing protein n=1 Tax=Rhizophagus irregularis TaxID=588596 RepID=A0A2N1MUM8_9GLOM|nr:hypothetical protein RhiirC2_853671 [Rhizophagus irregularis]